STEEGAHPPASQARRAACSARWELACSSVTQCRNRMPVRRTIASESRRIPELRSPLLTARAGRYEPVPTIPLCHTIGLHEPHETSSLASLACSVSYAIDAIDARRDRRDGARDA